MVECLPSLDKALVSIPRTRKKSKSIFLQPYTNHMGRIVLFINAFYIFYDICSARSCQVTSTLKALCGSLGVKAGIRNALTLGKFQWETVSGYLLILSLGGEMTPIPFSFLIVLPFYPDSHSYYFSLIPFQGLYSGQHVILWKDSMPSTPHVHTGIKSN